MILEISIFECKFALFAFILSYLHFKNKKIKKFIKKLINTQKNKKNKNVKKYIRFIIKK